MYTSSNRSKQSVLIQSDRKVTHPGVWYLVLAINECDEVQLADEYVQNVCKGYQRSRVDSISDVALTFRRLTSTLVDVPHR